MLLWPHSPGRSPQVPSWLAFATRSGRASSAGGRQAISRICSSLRLVTWRAVWIESANSVGFSMGFTCTAFIPEDDAARFLYWYPSGSLADVMDKEVRARVQQAAAEVAVEVAFEVADSPACPSGRC